MTGKKKKLNYRFHNPNTVQATAEQLLKMFVKVNEEKVEKEIREALTEDVKVKSLGTQKKNVV